MLLVTPSRALRSMLLRNWNPSFFFFTVPIHCKRTLRPFWKWRKQYKYNTWKLGGIMFPHKYCRPWKSFDFLFCVRERSIRCMLILSTHFLKKFQKLRTKFRSDLSMSLYPLVGLYNTYCKVLSPGRKKQI